MSNVFLLVFCIGNECYVGLLMVKNFSNISKVATFWSACTKPSKMISSVYGCRGYRFLPLPTIFSIRLWNCSDCVVFFFLNYATSSLRLTWRVALVELDLLTFPERMSSPPVVSGIRVTRSLVLWLCCVDRFLSFVLFLLVIVLSVLRFTDSDYLPLVSSSFSWGSAQCVSFVTLEKKIFE
jgi:hypothetical protein